MAFTNITTPEINKGEFSELVVDLLEDFVHGDASPFKDVKSVLEDYLDGATELDANQKAGIFADWLKSSYSDINTKAMDTAVAILKANAGLELDKYSAEGKYNLELVQADKIAAEIAVVDKESANKDAERALLEQKLLNEKAAYMVEMAKVKKQYGYGAAVVDTTLDANMGASSRDGAIDRQIEGYTRLNYKDMLKTMDEKASLMQNAKIPESLYEKASRMELMFEISRMDGSLDGVNYKLFHNGKENGNTDVTYVYNPGATPFSGTWIPALP